MKTTKTTPTQTARQFPQVLRKVASSALLLGLLVSIRGEPAAQARVDDPQPPVATLETLATHTASSAELRQMSIVQQAEEVAPCVAVARGYYCIGLGFRDEAPNYRRLLADDLGAMGDPRRFSGDMSFGEWVRTRVAMPQARRQASQAAEAKQAARGLNKQWAINQMLAATEAGEPQFSIDGDPLATAVHLRPVKKRGIMRGHATKQRRSYFCGVASFQMLDWADDGTREPQTEKARMLGTSPTGGTSIANIVDLTNRHTRWDREAGPFVMQGVSNWSVDQFWAVHVSHLGDRTPAPIIEHTLFLTTYFPYLKHDGNGHFQVGRGYYQRNDKSPRYVKIFEPWNEADWWKNDNQTWGRRRVNVTDLLAATKAHPMANIGL